MSGIGPWNLPTEANYVVEFTENDLFKQSSPLQYP